MYPVDSCTFEAKLKIPEKFDKNLHYNSFTDIGYIFSQKDWTYWLPSTDRISSLIFRKKNVRLMHTCSALKILLETEFSHHMVITLERSGSFGS